MAKKRVAEKKPVEAVTLDSRSLPILHECDAVVVDGSVAGVATALALARAGRKVAVVESRTYLGREITATLRPWVVGPAQGLATSSFPEPLRSLLETGGATAVLKGEIPLRMDAVKTCLEDLLLGAGVKILFASRPVALWQEEGALRGVVIANKSGRQVVACRLVVDATATALVCRLAGAAFQEEDGRDRFVCARTAEFEGVTDIEGSEMAVPAELGLATNSVRLHRGYRGPGHVLVEHFVESSFGTRDAWSLTKRDAQARARTQALVLYLRANVPAFANAVWGGSSYELSGPGSAPMASEIPEWAGPVAGAVLSTTYEQAPDGVGLLPHEDVAGSFAGPIRGLWCLNDALRSDVGALSAGMWWFPLCATTTGECLGRMLAENWEAVAAPAPEAPDTEAESLTFTIPLRSESGLAVEEQRQPQRGRAYEMCDVESLDIPVVRTADVLVVGGGSGGLMASIAAARQGMRTVLVDMNPGLGGTGTYGGIDLYWFPRESGITREFFDRVSDMHERLGLVRPHGIMPSCDIAARLWVQMDAAEEAGVEMLLNATAFGTIVEDDTVRGIVAATATGPVAILGKVVVDATGDGDVAAWAGAETVLGSDRENVVMYALMPEADKPGHWLNVKTSMLDPTNIEDYTRMILVERRRHKGGSHDHAIYLAPRESRHVLGDVTLTLTDQLIQRAWPDVVYTAFSNCDIKGLSTSDWHLMGLQSPNLMIEIPYGALVPSTLDGILVAGKAYSATHDAIAAPRMQPDIENLGGVVGHAAAMAVRMGKTPRDIDVTALQEELAAHGLLPAGTAQRQLAPLDYSDEDLRAMIAALDGDKPLHSYSNMDVGTRFEGRVPIVDILCAGERVVPMLEEALAEAEGSRAVLLAQALSAVGSRAGVPVLLAALEKWLAGKSLPERTAHIKHVGFPPNQCGAPDAGFLLYSLAMARDARALPVWQRVVDLLATTTEQEMVDKLAARYYYVEAVCYGAERLADPAAVPILKQLHSYAPLHGRQCLGGLQVDWVPERIAYLEIEIGRALARCGCADGYDILIAYLDDVRTILAEVVHRELVDLAGDDLGKDAAAWREWLDENRADLACEPLSRMTDPEAAWDEEFLTCGAEAVTR